MTDKNLKTLIDKLNKGKTNGLIHLRHLSELVDFAKVWPNTLRKTDRIFNPDGPNSFYFIKNEEGVYVATVSDMTNDLHWFVDKKYRKKGYLTIAMEQTILPHLFQDRDRQRITIDENQIGKQNYLSSLGVALKLGFKEGHNLGEFFLTPEQDAEDSYIIGESKLFTSERLEELKKEINYLGKSLWLIQSEVEMSLGESYFSEELLEMAKEIRSYAVKLEDTWWDCKKELSKQKMKINYE